MEKEIRNRIQSATQATRRLLQDEYAEQLEGRFAILRSGVIAADAGEHLDDADRVVRSKIVAAIAHKVAGGMTQSDGVDDFIRDAAFTTLNRFAALKMLEARDLVRECVSRREESAGYREFFGFAPALPVLREQEGYRLYLESIFDELSSEIKVLFDRRDPASLVWPRRQALNDVLAELNSASLDTVWSDDETIGWIYQYFNADVDRESARYDEEGNPKPPQNSRELAVRNQFFTPRYVVRFLTDNTLGRLWREMREGDTALVKKCEFLVRSGLGADENNTPVRAKKDPRDLRILDPACGSGHFLLYSFDLLLTIYEEAWLDDEPPSEVTGKSLRAEYGTLEDLRRAAPGLILRHNLFGVEIDPRCAQIAALALWMRAQREFASLKVRASERPRIRRTNIVIAEAMPREKELRASFLGQLDPKLGRLLQRIFEALESAGELGTLLKLEKDIDDAIREANPGQGPLLNSMNAERWRSAEAELLSALDGYGSAESNRDSFRRRLFVDDATSGLAFIDAVRQRYDVLLMNPPFGDPTESTKEYVNRKYPASRQDLFAVFVERAVRELVPSGYVGVLSAEAGFFRRTLEAWRREVLLKMTSMTVFAHLGGHVLDGAIVRTAAYVLATGNAAPQEPLFIRVYKQERREERLIAAVRNPLKSDYVFRTPQSEFEKLPRAVFGYWCSPELRDSFATLPKLEGHFAAVRVGLQTSDDFRFVRLRWEVDADSINTVWIPFAKGGEYRPFHDDVHLVVNWANDGAEIIAWGKGRPQNTEHFGKPGLTYPHRTAKRFAPRALATGNAFGHKGPGIVDIAGSPYALLALLNSRAVAYLLSLSLGAADSEGGAGANSYDVGIVQQLPVPRAASTDVVLANLGKSSWLNRAARDVRDETTALFVSPIAPIPASDGDLDVIATLVDQMQQRLDSRYVELQLEMDRRVLELYDFSQVDSADIEEQVGDVHRPSAEASDALTLAVELMQFLVGVAFGRWNIARLVRNADFAGNDAFAERGLQPDDLDVVAFLSDDPGTSSDLLGRISSATELNQDYVRLLGSCGNALQPAGGVREWLRKQFFDEHIGRYSKSRRSAPIYWQLATPSASYGIWLYAQALTRDSLFQVRKELIEPKLMHEERTLARLTQDGGSSPTAQQRKAIATHEVFVEELRAFRDEIARVAPLWNPNLDDGIVITCAPLWRLFPQHKRWQRELKNCWDDLCSAKYDWSRLAMHLWPERVVPLCAKDRSIAIAHGLERVFWFEETAGRWRAKNVSRDEIDEIIREHSSPAVKQALNDLMNAPAPGGSRRSRRVSARAVETLGSTA